jgi:hypothetical protein
VRKRERKEKKKLEINGKEKRREGGGSMISKRFGVKPKFTIYWPFLSGLSRSSILLVFK